MQNCSEGIYYLHSKLIVHKDIKPQNILYDSQTQKFKICDFGLSVIADKINFDEIEYKGTPAFIPPDCILE